MSPNIVNGEINTYIQLVRNTEVSNEQLVIILGRLEELLIQLN